MAARRDSWDKDDSVYTEQQVESVLSSCGVIVEGETGNDFTCLCPYHGNTDTPSMTVSKRNGKFFCFNPSCNQLGSLIDLVRYTSGKDHFAAARMIIKAGREEPKTASDRIRDILDKEPEFKRFDQDLDKMYEFFWLEPRAYRYMMEERGFTEETLRYFRVGYSAKKDMVIVPMHAPDGMPVGLIGRGIEEKKFKNSRKLPRNKTLWNFHRAKRTGAEYLIICESVFDAMRIYQAGYPNVVAVLGGYMSPEHFAQVEKYFKGVIIFTDVDNKRFDTPCRVCMKAGLNLCKGHRPGRDLGRAIVAGLPNKRTLWALYDKQTIYPHGAKDAGAMTDQEIRQCILNAVPHFEYVRLNLDK